MKKRILSLFLALAMVATAAVVPAGTAEAAATVGSRLVILDNASAPLTGPAATIAEQIDKGRMLYIENNEGDVSYDWQSFDIAVGHTINVNLSSNASHENDLSVMKVKDTYAKNGLKDNVNFQIIKWDTSEGEFVKVAGVNVASYTLTKSDVGDYFAVAIWVPMMDDDELDPQYAADDFDEWLMGTTVSGDAFGDGVEVMTPAAAAAAAGTVGVVSMNTKAVTFGEISADMLELDTYTAGGVTMHRLGNILFTDNENVGGTARNMSVEMTFKAASNVEKEDLYAGEDKATNVRNKANDAIIWQVSSLARNATSIKATGRDNDGTAATTVGAVVLDQLYNIYAEVNRAGKYYNAGKVVKTNYQIVVIDSGAASKAVYLDYQYGENETVVGRGGNDSKDINLVDGSGASRYAYIPIPTQGGKVPLPQPSYKENSKTGEIKYFQGWGTKPDAKTAIATTAPTLYTATNYYAIWGDTPKGDSGAVYRLYNPRTGEHLYTGDYNEYVVNGANGWNQEGISWYGFTDDEVADMKDSSKATRVRRLYNKVTHEHLYILDGDNEMNVLLKNPNWVAEQVVFVAPLAGMSIYRLFNPKSAGNARASHLWTTDNNEMNYLRANGWNYEGVPFFGIAQ